MLPFAEPCALLLGMQNHFARSPNVVEAKFLLGNAKPLIDRSGRELGFAGKASKKERSCVSNHCVQLPPDPDLSRNVHAVPW